MPKVLDSYIATIVAAAKTHAGCSAIADKIGNVLRLAFARGIRQPNDWEFQFNGVAQFRWFDGKAYSDSTKAIGVVVTSDRFSLSGRIAKDKYGEHNNVRIDWLNVDQACLILSVLVDVIDEQPKAERKAGA